MAQQLDLETMPLADLRKLALEESDKTESTEAPTTTAQPRDEQGRFAGKDYQDEFDNSDETQLETATDEIEETEPEPEEYVYRREIDLCDGSGVQVFTGKGVSKEEALEALTDKLAEAQKNATKKINELAKQVKNTPEKPKAKQFTPDEEYIYSQEFQTKPSEAFKKLFKETTGFAIEDFQTKIAAVEAFEKAQTSLAVQQNFVATHSDYVGTPSNGEKMQAWVQTHGYSEFTEDNLEKAYQDLKKSGLLKLKTEGADVATEGNGADSERIAPPVSGTTQQRSPKKGSTISIKGRSTAPMKSAPSEDELYSMPMDKLRQLSNEQLKASQE